MGTSSTTLRQTGTYEVLVVDDEEDIRAVLTLALEEEGYRVVSATHGAQALAHLFTRLPAVMLLDLNMPVMGGWEVLDHLQAARITVPVIIMTAGQRGRAEAERRGVAGYLAKPFDLAQLFETVQRCVQGAA